MTEKKKRYIPEVRNKDRIQYLKRKQSDHEETKYLTEEVKNLKGQPKLDY